MSANVLTGGASVTMNDQSVPVWSIDRCGSVSQRRKQLNIAVAHMKHLGRFCE